MANRFWTGAVNGGTGTWDTTDTANWSATSGGAGGASVPTTGDVALFDVNSGAGICTLGSNVTVPTLNLTGYTGTLDFSTFKIGITNSGTTILNLGTTAAYAGLKRIEITANASSGTRTITGTLAFSPGGREANAPDIFVLAGTDTISGGIHCRDLDFTGFSGSVTGAFQTVYGDFVASPTMTTNSGTSPITFSSTSATTRTITTNGVTFNFELRFDGVGGTWALQDDLTISSIRRLRSTNGTFDANDKNITLGGYITSAGTKTLNMGSGTWTVTGNDAGLTTTTWRADFAGTGLTVIPGTATINMTSADAKTFAGASNTWPTLNQGGAGALTITGANTFTNITNTVQPATITFPASTTTTVSAFSVSGTSGNQITLNSSTPGTRATLSDASSVNSVSFCDIQDINATGGAIWNSFTKNGNVNSGNNLNWTFNSISNSIYDSLRLRGYTGTVTDMLLQYYKANGATSNSLQDAESEFLILKGFTFGSNTDKWFSYLRSLNFTGTVTDMLFNYWKDPA
jgi:hypothetical protein